MNRVLWILLALGLFACRATPTPLADISPLTTASPLPDISATETLPAPALAAPASLAPTGVTVVYVKDGNLWLWAGGSASRLTDSGQDSAPRLTDDGKLALFLRETHLWSVNADGTNSRRLDALDASTGVMHYSLLPRTHTVYFTTQLQGGGIPEPSYDLYRVEADAPPASLLLEAGEAGLVTFSPDGQWLALAQPDKINVARLDGSELNTVLTFPRVVTNSQWAFIPEVAWLSNSYGFKTVIPSADGAQPARYLFVAATGGEPAQLALIHAAPVTRGYFPFISPGSDNVAYLREQGDDLELHIIDASTADHPLLSHARDKLGLLGWAGDGQSLVFWTDDPGKTQLRRPDGSLQLLSDVASGAQVTWIDATQFLFLNGNELRLRSLGQASSVLDSGNITEFSGVIVR